MGRLEFRTDPLPPAVGLAVYAGVCGGLACFGPTVAASARALLGGADALFVGVLAAVLIAGLGLAAVCAAHLCDRSVQLVIDEDGINDRRDGGAVRWPAVRDVRLRVERLGGVVTSACLAVELASGATAWVDIAGLNRSPEAIAAGARAAWSRSRPTRIVADEAA